MQCFLMLIFVLLGFVTEIGGSSLKPVLTGPSKAYLRSQVQFHCEVPGWTSPLTFELRKDTDLITTENNIQVTFPLQVTEGSEGKYHCRVTGGQTSNSIQFQVVTPVAGVRVTSDPDPPVLYEGQKFSLRCLVRKGTHLSFSWDHEQRELNASSDDRYRLAGDALTVDAASERHAGTYSCTAQNMMQVNPRFSGSQNLHVIVKKYISTLKLSFTVFSNGSGLMANISCRLARGSPPVMFSLLVNGLEMDVTRVDSLEFWSVRPVSLGLDMGVAQCKAQAETQQLLSDPEHLHVVPVGGAVRVMVKYLYDVDAVTTSARLTCVPERGTFPTFSWFLNRSSLPPEGDAHVEMQNGRILFLTDISSGYYRCRARDSFNDSSIWVESEDVFIQKTDLSATPMEVIALVFCGFLLMVIVGASCFLFWSTKLRNSSCEHRINHEIQSDATPLNFPADVSFKPQNVEMNTFIMNFAD